MKEKSPEKELNNNNNIIDEFETVLQGDFIVINKSQIPNISNINKISLLKEKSKEKKFNKSEIKERRKSNDIVERNCLKRIVTKKKAQYLNFSKNNIEIIKGENDKENEIEEISDFKADCILYDKNNNVYTGKLFIDQNYMVQFSGQLNETPKYFNSDYYIFPLLLISQCINNTNYFGQSNYCKEITLKDSRNFIFKFSPHSFKDFNELIDKYVFPEKTKNYFNFAYSYKKSKNNEKNIKIYNFFDEFKRQGIQNFSTSKEFRVMKNTDYKFCESYPKRLIVPNNITDEELKKCSEFRTKNRIPTLTYRYNLNGSCIWRSSQTKGGFSNYANKSDVLLLTLISNKKKLYIYDARPYLNAMANKFKGAGYENINNYPEIDIKLIFCGLPNIHTVRNAYQKMMTTASYNTNTDTTILYNISNSYWYEYISTLIKSSFQISESIRIEKANILIHCSDGWDRTSQLCSMTEIILDKYYRTLDGFICLIEKDWISFGYQFRYRGGFYSVIDSPHNIVNENQFSPIFIQWLDAVYQLMMQNYEKFEFNFNLILLLAEELYSGKYGTFMFNNEKDREDFKEDKTYSIWNYIKQNEKKFINKLYNKDDNKALVFNYKKIKIWKDYFYRFEKGNNEEYYFHEYDKKIKVLEDKQKEDKDIIEKMAKFICDYYNNEDIEKLDDKCKKIISKLRDKK